MTALPMDRQARNGTYAQCPCVFLCAVADGTQSPLKSRASTSSSSSLSLSPSSVAAPLGELGAAACQVVLNHYRPTALPRSRYDVGDEDSDPSSRLPSACGGETTPWLIKVGFFGNATTALVIIYRPYVLARNVPVCIQVWGSLASGNDRAI